jgi:NADPH-dependent 2,4-dienoyl-CoA reductase/sulfur reductase-like enzyme
MGHLVIVGGSDAGISAALRAREIDPTTEVTVVVADTFPNFSICGLPFYLSGEVPDWRMLAHRTAAEIEAQGIELLLNHTAIALDAAGKRVLVRDEAGASQVLPYDRVIVGTGAEPAPPAIPGGDLPGVYPLHSMEQSFRVWQHLAATAPRHAVIVGAGYIGMEMADALTHRGLRVTLLQRGPSVLRTVDPSLGRLLAEEMERHGVEVVTGAAVAGIEPAGGRLRVVGEPALRVETDLVLLGTGVRPVTGLAREAGAALGTHGAIRVTRAMETSLPDVYAAGDCVETWHRVLEASVYLPLGTTSHKQGRVAGENAAGGHAQFMGSLGTQVVKVFNLAAARTGLLEAEARAAGYAAATSELTAWDHKAYYPGAQPLTLRVTGAVRTGRLLGAQIVGHWQAEVAKRIDIFAAALYHGMRVDELSDLDLSYTPPVSSPWDPVQMAAQAWAAAQRPLVGVEAASGDGHAAESTDHEGV